MNISNSNIILNSSQPIQCDNFLCTSSTLVSRPILTYFANATAFGQSISPNICYSFNAWDSPSINQENNIHNEFINHISPCNNLSIKSYIFMIATYGVYRISISLTWEIPKMKHLIYTGESELKLSIYHLNTSGTSTLLGTNIIIAPKISSLNILPLFFNSTITIDTLFISGDKFYIMAYNKGLNNTGEGFRMKLGNSTDNITITRLS